MKQNTSWKKPLQNTHKIVFDYKRKNITLIAQFNEIGARSKKVWVFTWLEEEQELKALFTYLFNLIMVLY